MKIYKYEYADKIELPKGAVVLNVLYQKWCEKWFVYALVDPDNEMEIREFQSVETGGTLNDFNLLVKPTYITTTMTHEDRYVLSFFENVKL